MTNGNEPNPDINEWEVVSYKKKTTNFQNTLWQTEKKQQQRSKQAIQADQTSEMISIALFIKNYEKIIEAIKDQGFFEPILFKGFCYEEEHNLNIHLQDRYPAEAEPKPRTHRRLTLKDQLDALLNCKIILTIDEQMDPYYVDKLNPNNSVKLTAEIPLQAIENVFGKNWYFNPADNYPDYWRTPLVPN